MSLRTTFQLSWMVVVLAAACPHALLAQASAGGDATRDASARALFEEGVELAEKSDWEHAEDRFRRALALRSSPVIAYNLANALAERGHLVEASEQLRKLALDDKLDSGLRHSVEVLQADVTPRIGRLTVNVAAPVAGDVVKLDDQALIEAQLGVGVPVDPGPHRITLERGRSVLDTQSVELAAGGSAQVSLQPVAAPTPSETAAAAQPKLGTTQATSDATRDTAGQPVTKTWWFWTGVGVVGVAAIVVVAVVASSSSSSGSSADTYHGSFNPPSLKVEVAP